MAKKEEHLSPEEKLLRVIQGGEKRKGADQAQAAAAPAVADAADKGKLKLAKGAAAATASAEPKAASAEKPGAAAPRKSATPRRPAFALDLNLRTVNIVLAVVVLVVLLFTGHEILANVRVETAGEAIVTSGLPPAPAPLSDHDLPPLEKLLDDIDQRPLFAVVQGPVPTQPVGPMPTPPSDYCSLLGISQLPGTNAFEAIIKDAKLTKTLYLKVGDVISADGQPWKVKDIQSDSVVFESGNRESVVK